MSTQGIHRTRWRILSETRTGFRLRYPQTTPQGHPVRIKEASVGGGIRLHFVSENSQELYFEITWYSNLSPAEGYERLKQELEKRFDEINVTELKERTIGPLPAFAFSFKWPEHERVVIFIPKNRATYRVLYDPRSPINLEILSTLELQ